MTNQDTSQVLVEHYLSTLRNQMFQVPLSAREEFISEINDHITEGRASLEPEDIDSLRALLAHLGSPSELAMEVIEGQRELTRQMSLAKRVRKLLRPILALIVVVLIFASLGWWTHYQPMRPAPLLQTWPSITYSDGKLVPQVNAASSDLPNEVPIWKMPSGTSTIHIFVSIENAQSFPIKITGVQSPFQGWPEFGTARIDFGPDGGIPKRHFRSFSLGGKHSEEVSLAIPMHCMATSGSTVEPTRVLVSTSFLGVSHQVWVNIEPFDIEFAKTC
ncbi:MAG TPA: hypothetical protein VIJ40_03590 [Acidimicrobiales bacterium]